MLLLLYQYYNIHFSNVQHIIFPKLDHQINIAIIFFFASAHRDNASCSQQFIIIPLAITHYYQHRDHKIDSHGPSCGHKYQRVSWTKSRPIATVLSSPPNSLLFLPTVIRVIGLRALCIRMRAR